MRNVRMMNLILMITALVLVAAILVLMSTGCARVERATQTPVNVSRFQRVETSLQYAVLVDRETGVMHAMSLGANNLGTFTLLVDAEGNPLIWKGEQK